MSPLAELLANRVPVDENDPTYASLLNQLQCNILASHQRPVSVYFFLNLPDDAGEARTLCRELASGRWEGAPAGLALRAERAFRADRAAARERKRQGLPGREPTADVERFPFAVNLLLSATAYAKLGKLCLPDEEPFRLGMRGYEAAQVLGPKLNDPEGARLVNGSGPDILYIVAAYPEQHAQLELAVGSIRAHLKGHLLRQELGSILMHKTKPYALEPFGYHDSISQPRFFASDLAARVQIEGDAATVKGGAWLSFYPLKQVLVPDPNVPGSACGSYFVFRKLKQKVADFYRQAQELATATGRHRDDIADELVGRRVDGTPLAPSPNLNDFDYRGRAICPAHAHARKINPRESWSRDAQLVRRATVYGPELERDAQTGRPILEDGDVLPKGAETGLLFLCAQASISKQFLVLQANWANDTGGGADTVIAQLAPQQKNRIGIAVPGEAFTGLRHQYEPVVESLGGEYFFAPSIIFFSQL